MVGLASMALLTGASCSSSDAAPSEDGIDLGVVASNGTSRFQIPEDALGFTVVLSSDDARDRAFGLAPAIAHLERYGERFVVDNRFASEATTIPGRFPPRGPTITVGAPFDSRPVAGEWSLLVGTRPGRVRVELSRAPSARFDGGVVSLAIFVPIGAKLGEGGRAVDPRDLESDPRFARALDGYYEILARELGLARGKVTFESVPVDTGDAAEAVFARLPLRPGAIRVLLRDDQRSYFLGKSPVRGSWAIPEDGIELVLAPKTSVSLATWVLAHETGHWFGLFHTSEVAFQGHHDLASDTPQCASSLLFVENGKDCPDRSNLMFPAADGRPELSVLTDQQRRVVHGSPAYAQKGSGLAEKSVALRTSAPAADVSHRVPSGQESFVSYPCGVLARP